MRLALWQPPVISSAAEQAIIKRVRRAKLFVFLREQRHELFNVAFQEELATLYRDSPVGQPPTPPAQLALATIVQADTGASDDEVIEATTIGIPRVRARLPESPSQATQEPACHKQRQETWKQGEEPPGL